MLKFTLFLTLLSSVALADLNQCMLDICGPAQENQNYDFYMNGYYSAAGLSKTVTSREFPYHYQDYTHMASFSQSGATVSGTGLL